MKKIVYIISFFIILIFGYYFISFYPYLNKMNWVIQKVETIIDHKKIDSLKKNIIEKKRKSLAVSKKNMSVDSLMRRQAMMYIYNDFIINNRKKKLNRLWRFDRLFWSYMSYLHFNNDHIIKICLYYNSLSYRNMEKF
jgi:hypothetical protein